MKLTKLNSGEILACTRDEAETLLTILTETLERDDIYGYYGVKGNYISLSIVTEKF